MPSVSAMFKNGNPSPEAQKPPANLSAPPAGEEEILSVLPPTTSSKLKPAVTMIPLDQQIACSLPPAPKFEVPKRPVVMEREYSGSSSSSTATSSTETEPTSIFSGGEGRSGPQVYRRKPIGHKPKDNFTPLPSKDPGFAQPGFSQGGFQPVGFSQGGFASPTGSVFEEFKYDTTIETKTKTAVVKDVTTTIMVECRKQFSSRADEILLGTPTCHALLHFIAAERLRSMPHKGSTWDKVLKWAENFAKRIDAFIFTIGGFATYGWEGSRIIYGCCRALLQMGVKRVALLEKVFGILYQMGISLGFFLQQKQYFSSSIEIQTILVQSFSDVVSFIFDVTMRYKKEKTVDISRFDYYFGSLIDSFYSRKESFTSEVWSCALRQLMVTTKTTVTIHTIRGWLSSQDRTLEVFLSDRLGSRVTRYEYTCEWFEPNLRDFQRGSESLLWITGVSGCGKSVLSGWILERLRRTSHLRNGYDAVSFTISPYLKTQQTTMAVVKGLLLQLLERSVGDLSLYKVLTALYERTELAGVTDNLENALWKALDESLKKSGRVVLVVDGLEQLQGGNDAAHKLAKHLHGFANRHPDLKVILISRPMKPSFTCGHFFIEEKHNAADVRRYIEVKITKTHEFRSIKEEERTTIIRKLSECSKSTFVWAKYALELLKLEKTVQGMIDSIDKLPKDLPALIQRLSRRLDFKSADTRLIISFLIAAERPLSVTELKTLLEIDVRSCTRSTRLSSVEDDILAACGSLVVTRDGLVCFSHSSIKEYLLELCLSDDDFPLTIEDAHKDITIRSLAYLKLVLKDYDSEPDTDVCYDAGVITQKNRFFEYATRYWITHFRSSTMYRKGGKHTFTDEFKICFPGSTVLALIEGSWWEVQTSAAEAFEMHSLALELRRMCLGEKHKIVVQCYFNLGKTYSTKASSCDYYYKAWELLKSIDETLEITRKCASKYLEITEKTVTIRTETITKRTETVTRYVYVSTKRIHGECHKETIKWGKALVDILVTLKKLEESLTILREVRKACITVYGELHEETMRVTTTLTSVLTTSTTTTTITEEIETITKSVLEACETTMHAWEEQRITATIKMVDIYETKKEFKKAEELLISLRRQIIEACTHGCAVSIQEAKIEVTLQYCRFLKRQSRGKEAERLLVELWGEFKNQLHEKDCDHDSGLLVRIRIMGEQMSQWKIMTVAESLFSTLFGFYKKHDRITTTEGSIIALLLAGVLRGHKDQHSQEVILKEVFEATITSTTVTTVTIVKTTVELSSFYQREERWEEAIDVCKKALVRIWGSFSNFMIVSKTGVCGLPRSHHHEAIDIATRMAVCYYHQGLVHEAESVYLYILSSCRSSLELRNTLIMQAYETLVEFYTTIGKIDLAIQRYHELYEECREILGVSHEITIKVTYKVASYCKQYAPRKAERYYIEIVTCTHKHHELVTVETIEATLALCLIYERDLKIQEAIRYYKQLWELFCIRGRDCPMKRETVLEIYYKLIKLETRVEVRYQLSVQFREACVRHYGTYHFLTVKATIELAMIMETMEEHREASIRIYEEVCEIIREHSELRILISETTITEIKKRLAILYASHTKSISKAEIIYYESWEITRKRHGWAHEESLSRLYELIMFFMKQGKKECIDSAKTTISTAIIEILTREKDTQRLYGSGVRIAQMYLELGLKDLAWEYIKEVRAQLICDTPKTSQKFGFCLRKSHSIDRRLFIFVVAFERCLKGSITQHTYTEIIQDFLTESSLFESWMRTLQYNGTFETSLTVGSRLRLFLVSQERYEESDKITDELWHLFLSAVGEKADKKSLIYQLFLVCVSETVSQDSETSVLDAGVTAVVEHYHRSDFSGAYELGIWVFKYVMKHGGFTDERNIAAGFRLAICMAGTAAPKCTDATLAAKMMKLSKDVLAEVLKASEAEGVSFASMDLAMVNRIVALLGAQKDFKSMERILRSLWTARSTQPHWSSDVIVSIGSTLAECLFAENKRAEAICLAADIAYNLRRVWRNLDISTVQAFNLLSAFYVHEGQFTKAMDVHTDVIRRGLEDDEEDGSECEEAKEMVTDQLRLLKRAFQRNGGKWESEEAREAAIAVWEEAEKWFGESGVEKVENWKKSDKNFGTENMGKWSAPATWGFALEEARDADHSWENAGMAIVRTYGHFEASQMQNGSRNVNEEEDN